MIVDANLLLYAVDEASPFHEPAAAWAEVTFNGLERVALPWQSLVAFVRIMTNPRATRRPLSHEQAWGAVEEWVALPGVWVPPASENTVRVLGELVMRHRITANLVTDAALAALAIEHGLEIMTADTDFARFHEVRWRNPLRDA